MPIDGFIDWRMSAEDIYNLIRTLSKPYTNARSIISEEIILINRAIIIKYNFDNKPGTILNIYKNGEILVSCGSGALIIQEYDIKNMKYLLLGSCFKSISMKKTVRTIIKRFKNEFPNKKMNSTLLSFWQKRNLL